MSTSVTRNYPNSIRETYRNESSTNKFNVLEDVDGDAAADDLTVIAKLGPGDTRFAAKLALTTHNSATAISLTAFASMDDGATYAQLQSRDISAGVATNEDFSDSKTVSGADSMWAAYDVSCATHVKVIADTTSGDSSDKLALQVAAGK